MSRIIAHDCIFFLENASLQPNKPYAFNCGHYDDRPHFCPALRYGKCRAFISRDSETDFQRVLTNIIENNIEDMLIFIFPFNKYEDLLRKYHETYHNTVTTYIISKLDIPDTVNNILL